jgi:hypothetical protein
MRAYYDCEVDELILLKLRGGEELTLQGITRE